VAAIGFVPAGCAKAGWLDHEAFVQLEPGGGQSCEEAKRFTICPLLERTDP
jgi:hypothetical protein